jgi:hypothetical protein
MIYYRVYGLTFRSQRELPGLDRIQETRVVDYTLRFDTCTNRFEMLRSDFDHRWYISPWRVKCGRTVVEVWKTDDCRKFLFQFYDGIEFIVDQEGGAIWVDGLRKVSLQAATQHLLFSLPGFLLGLRKSACLHGAAIGLGNSAIALVGRSTSGKSVLSAKMAARRIEVLSDDLVALDVIGNTVKVYPGYPWICLRQGSLHWLEAENLDAAGFPVEWHYLDEAYVTLDLRRMGGPFRLNSRKLEAIYLLEPVEDSRCRLAIEPVPPHQALMALMEAADRTHVRYSEFRPQQFSLMGSVVAAVPTYALRYHLSADSLTTLSDLFIQHPGLRSRWREEIEA